MGRLNYRSSRRSSRLGPIKFWFLPILVASLIVFGAHLTLASTDPTVEELTEYLQSNQLYVATEITDGYQQVFYEYEDNKIILTEGKNNHTNPVSSDEYITWHKIVDGSAQLILYNVLTKAELQLSGYSVNQQQVMQRERVVWEQWNNDRWQIMYFDGFSVRKLSSADTAVRAAIKDDQILYAQQNNAGEWRVLRYDISTDQTEVIATGDEPNAWPHFSGDEIKTNYPTLD